MDFINKIFRGDRVIWMIFMFLCLISIVEVYSASSTLTFRTDYWKPIMRHTMFLLGGVAIVLFIHSVKPQFFSVIGIALPIAWVLLVATRFFGEYVNGSYRFLNIAGISFQPSEIAKICLMVLTAFILSKRRDVNDMLSFRWIMALTIITCALIMIDNGSTAIMLFGIIFLMMFIGQISRKKLFILGASLILLGGMGYATLKYMPMDTLTKVFPRADTWKARFIDFNADEDIHQEGFEINDDNYQVAHANIAIANGRVIGKMPGNSQERDFLPQAYSDFIYAIIVEEMGVIGGVFVLFLYIILFVRAGIIAGRSDKLFPKFLVIGSSLVLVTQALINMAVAVSLIPVTGQPLPLVSRGGTSILITCIYIGIVLSVSRFENPKGAKREEEIVEELTEEQRLAKDAVFVEVEVESEDN